MATTYTLISSVTVGILGASSIDFTSIPATYTDLNVLVSARTNRASDSDYIKMTFNGSTSTYSGRFLYGDGASTTSSTTGSAANEINRANATTSTASVFGNISVYLPNYAGSNYKSGSFDGVNENNATTAYDWLGATLWSTTSAITSIKLEPGAGTSFNQYSTAYLYGISNA